MAIQGIIYRYVKEKVADVAIIDVGAAKIIKITTLSGDVFKMPVSSIFDKSILQIKVAALMEMTGFYEGEITALLTETP